MIEIECFQREPSCGIHMVKIWINGNLVFANEISNRDELISWRDALHNELLWLNRYLRDNKVNEVCAHEATFVMTHPDRKTHTCIKCGAYYE